MFNKIVFFLILALYGCSAPQKVKDEATTLLKGNCLDMFLDASVGKYQYVANSPTGKVAFAYASDGGGFSCGMATNMAWDTTDSLFFSMPNIDKMEALAIQRCERQKPTTVKSMCRTFARGNDIVWGKFLNKGLE